MPAQARGLPEDYEEFRRDIESFSQRIVENDDASFTVTGPILFHHIGACIYSGYESALAVNLTNAHSTFSTSSTW